MLSPTELITHGAWGRGRTYDLWLRRPLLFHWATQAIKKFKIMILAATYSYTSTRCTTIGTNWLNFCVRDGNRCTPAVITTKILTSNLIIYILLCCFAIVNHSWKYFIFLYYVTFVIKVFFTKISLRQNLCCSCLLKTLNRKLINNRLKNNKTHSSN